MPIPGVSVSPEQRDKLLDLEENHFNDLKDIRIPPAKLTRSLSAFANADGGELFVGISESDDGNRKWEGFENIEAANGHIQAIEASFPLGQDVSIEFLACEEAKGLVLHIQIAKTADIKTASDGKVYLRRGAQNLPQTSEEDLSRLKLNKGLTSFESQTVSAALEEISNSAVMIGFLLDVIPTAEPLPWLRKQQLIREDKPTVAGVLLFAEEPQAIVPKHCGLKVYRYKTTGAPSRETLAFDPITIDGCIYDQIAKAVSKTVMEIESISVLGSEGFEKVSYPVEALHEIITNAVLHRDYSIADDVHVRIFDNRVEIESPGKLPAHVTVENILRERFARNGKIVRLINKFPNPPNKDVGEGLNTAFEAMRKLRLKEPVVEQQPNSVLVSVRHEPLASPEEIVMAYLEDNSQINNSKGREICHIGSENVMKRVFERLTDSGMIERVPGMFGRAAAYRKKVKASS